MWNFIVWQMKINWYLLPNESPKGFFCIPLGSKLSKIGHIFTFIQIFEYEQNQKRYWLKLFFWFDILIQKSLSRRFLASKFSFENLKCTNFDSTDPFCLTFSEKTEKDTPITETIWKQGHFERVKPILKILSWVENTYVKDRVKIFSKRYCGSL